jgi:hypothetical protein
MSEEDVRRELNREAAAAGVDPAASMNETGMILTAATKDLWSKEALAEWDAAIEEYRSLISK